MSLNRYLIDSIEAELVKKFDTKTFNYNNYQKLAGEISTEFLISYMMVIFLSLISFFAIKCDFFLFRFMGYFLVFAIWMVNINVVGTLFSYEGKESPKLIILFLLNKMIKGTEERLVEVEAFVQANRESWDNRRKNVEKRVREIVNNELKFLLDRYENRIDLLVNEIFGRKEQSLISFYNQLKHDEPHFKKVVLWSLLIPRKNISLDTLKYIISSYRIDNSLYNTIVSSKEITKEEYEMGFDSIFKNYKEKQIKRWFQSNFNTQDYYKIITVLKNYKGDFSVFPNINEAINHVLEYSENFKNNLFDLEQLKKFPKLTRLENAKLGEYRFVIIKDIEELNWWGKSLKHCIKTYFKKCYTGECFLIGVYVEESGKKKAYANIEVDKKLNIVQLKGVQNSSVNNSNYIRDFVKEMLKAT